MNHLMSRLKGIMTKDLKRSEGVVISRSHGNVKVATRSGLKTFSASGVIYKTGEKVSYDDTLGVVGRKRSSSSSKVYRV